MLPPRSCAHGENLVRRGRPVPCRQLQRVECVTAPATLQASLGRVSSLRTLAMLGCRWWLAAALVVMGTTLCFPAQVWALGEVITDVRIRNNNRTSEDTIRAMAGIDLGQELESQTLELVRERLNTSGMFADVDVFWEPYRGGVRVVITVREKFPWAPVPTFSFTQGNISFGAVLVHGNLWGSGKQAVIGGRISDVNSGAVLVYRDPAMFGSWFYWEVQGVFRDQHLPEFAMVPGITDEPLRINKLRSFGGSLRLGVAWWRRVRTEIGWEVSDWRYRGYEFSEAITDPGRGAESAFVGEGVAGLRFDFRAREHAIVTGSSLNVGLRLGNPTFGSDDNISYWKSGGEYFHGLRLGRRFNWLNNVGLNIGNRMPLWSENWAGGSNLRGFQYMRFRGDTHAYFGSEFHFPLFSVMQLDVRGLLFYDLHAVYWRTIDRSRFDGRNFLQEPYIQTGFRSNRDVHNGVGGGLRFYLRSVAVPLVGVDYGYGIEDEAFRMVLVVGA